MALSYIVVENPCSTLLLYYCIQANAMLTRVVPGDAGGVSQKKDPFQRLTMTKEQLLKMFAYNQFKCRIIRERVTTPTSTVYRCGDLIDLCRGPHLRNTGKAKAFTVFKNSAAYFNGDADEEVVQRVYGISFPDTKQMKQWKVLQEEAAKRNHKKIGIEQELFFFHELSPVRLCSFARSLTCTLASFSLLPSASVWCASCSCSCSLIYFSCGGMIEITLL